ncbi:MAG TPA: hypothetical protein VFS60_16450, partial [Thermoanaerobaculia bacterium]|nr:hypothetical protein [Thermoanaerobaculia bacterium]
MPDAKSHPPREAPPQQSPPASPFVDFGPSHRSPLGTQEQPSPPVADASLAEPQATAAGNGGAVTAETAKVLTTPVAAPAAP